jgi:hypothetical protein
VAILYNPIIPIFLDRSTWEIVNVITIGLMLFSYKK